MPWVKGQSGNPSGRPCMPIELREVRQLARTYSREACERIYLLMSCAEKHETQLAAAIALLKIAGLNMTADVNLTVNELPPPLQLASENLKAGLGPDADVIQ